MLNKTPLNEIHKKMGARMVDFGGWEMPVQYRGVIDEHLAVRNAAGLFDVSHMGEIEIKGTDALDFIQEVAINDASKLTNGQVQYTAMCYPHGGVIDDFTLYRFDENHYLCCVNAANISKDFAWMEQVLEEGSFGDVKLRNRSDDYALVALQGPAADDILSLLTDTDLGEIPFYHFYEGLVNDEPTIISRTGYTGERGFELFFAPDKAESIWQALLAVGEPLGLMPVGLGARDTLRLEKKYPLYGHELSENINPLEAGLGWITKFDKPSFIGRDALKKVKEAGPSRKLVAFTMTEAGIPRAEYAVFAEGRQIGFVTSGTMSPSLRVGIGLALIEKPFASIGNRLEIGIRKRRVPAEIVKPPFVKK